LTHPALLLLCAAAAAAVLCVPQEQALLYAGGSGQLLGPQAWSAAVGRISSTLRQLPPDGWVQEQVGRGGGVGLGSGGEGRCVGCVLWEGGVG